MKIELVRKVMIVGIAMLIGIAVCVSVWSLLREHKTMEFQGENRPIRSNNEIAADNVRRLQPSQKSAGNPNEEPLTKKERVTRQASSMFMSSLSEEQLATPFAEKMLEAMNSPEYFVLMESDFTVREWNDFLESQGVEVVRGYPGIFRKFVPNMELVDYEPVVRRKFAELFIAAEPVDLTDPTAAADQRSSVFLELGKELTQTDMAAAAWIMETFGEDHDAAFRPDASNDSPAFVWMTDVQQNAVRIVANAETTDTATPSTQESAQSWNLSSVVENPSIDNSGKEESTALDTSQRTTMTDAEIMAEIEKSLTRQPPNMSTNKSPDTTGEIQSNLETTLKAQFSSERFERTMDTLERYGPEEGLRRLRETDPEVAKQVENSRHHNRQEDAQ